MMTSMSSGVVVRPIEPGDHDAWEQLFHAYRTFYEYDEEPGRRRPCLGMDPRRHPRDQRPRGRPVDDEVVGFAHHREFARPSSGKRGLYLDDLFTQPDLRGKGIGRALITRLGEMAQERGFNKVRWITAEDNHTAQRLYDDLAEKTTWVTYDYRV